MPESGNSNGEVEAIFLKAVRFIANGSSSSSTTGLPPPTSDEKLQYYALYKQATEGPCKTARPNFWDMVARAKWDSWKNLGQMGKEEAMKRYIANLTKAVPTWRGNDLLEGCNDDNTKKVSSAPATSLKGDTATSRLAPVANDSQPIDAPTNLPTPESPVNSSNTASFVSAQSPNQSSQSVSNIASPDSCSIAPVSGPKQSSSSGRIISRGVGSFMAENKLGADLASLREMVSALATKISNLEDRISRMHEENSDLKLKLEADKENKEMVYSLLQELDTKLSLREDEWQNLAARMDIIMSESSPPGLFYSPVRRSVSFTLPRSTSFELSNVGLVGKWSFFLLPATVAASTYWWYSRNMKK